MKGGKIVGAPRLNKNSLERAVRILDGWNGKLTWDRYLDELERVLGHRYSKVAMLKRPKIADAWKLAKERNSNGRARTGEPFLDQLQFLNDALKNENERLNDENKKLLVQFLRWQYNAYQKKGLTIEQLDEEMPPIDRRTTRPKK